MLSSGRPWGSQGPGKQEAHTCGAMHQAGAGRARGHPPSLFPTHAPRRGPPWQGLCYCKSSLPPQHPSQ